MSSRSPPPATPAHWADSEKAIPRGPPPQYIPDMDPEPNLGQKKTKKRPLTERNCCCRWLCCACCLPVWARYIVWFIIIAIIICIIVIAALLGTFKMPTVNLDGVTSSPEGNSTQITYNGKTFSINIGLIVNIQNPNVLPIRLSDIQAVANFPLDDGTKARLGQGTMDYQYVPTNSDFNFTFPFTISYEPSSRSSTLMLNSLMEKCGLTGGEAQDISVDYTISLAARVLFVTVHPTISSSASFACPLTNGGIPGLSSSALTLSNSGGDNSSS